MAFLFSVSYLRHIFTVYGQIYDSVIIFSPYFESPIERVAINAKMGSVGLATSSGANGEPATTMIAVSFGQKIRAMLFSESGNRVDVGTFDLNVAVDSLFFIGTQLVALSPTGKIGVWNSMTQHWQSQELPAPITSYDTAGSFLLLVLFQSCYNSE